LRHVKEQEVYSFTGEGLLLSLTMGVVLLVIIIAQRHPKILDVQTVLLLGLREAFLKEQFNI
jgi:hypothetical protein